MGASPLHSPHKNKYFPSMKNIFIIYYLNVISRIEDISKFYIIVVIKYLKSRKYIYF